MRTDKLTVVAVTQKEQERFWSKVERGGPDECWNWKAYKLSFGYGRVGWRGGVQLAHRVSYALAFGDIPEGQCVLHRCDNPSCCNPAHFRLGTKADNNHDKDNKGRGRAVKGSAHGQAKFTEADALLVKRTRARTGFGYRKIARLTSLPEPFVGRVLYLKKWAHVTV